MHRGKTAASPATPDVIRMTLLHDPGTCHHPLTLGNTAILKWKTQLFTTVRTRLTFINLITKMKKYVKIMNQNSKQSFSTAFLVKQVNCRNTKECYEVTKSWKEFLPHGFYTIEL